LFFVNIAVRGSAAVGHHNCPLPASLVTALARCRLKDEDRNLVIGASYWGGITQSAFSSPESTERILHVSCAIELELVVPELAIVGRAGGWSKRLKSPRKALATDIAKCVRRTCRRCLGPVPKAKFAVDITPSNMVLAIA